MRAIMNRLRRLENTTAPVGRNGRRWRRFLAARQRRLGAEYEPLSFPLESYAGCRTIADRILKLRWNATDEAARQEERQNRRR